MRETLSQKLSSRVSQGRVICCQCLKAHIIASANSTFRLFCMPILDRFHTCVFIYPLSAREPFMNSNNSIRTLPAQSSSMNPTDNIRNNTKRQNNAPQGDRYLAGYFEFPFTISSETSDSSSARHPSSSPNRTTSSCPGERARVSIPVYR